MSMRKDGRQNNQIRPVKIRRGYIKNAQASVLIETGNTEVICTATCEERVPPWLKGFDRGWITAEYFMLPASASTRVSREQTRSSGRTHEIQRMIGRSLRAVTNLDSLGERTIIIDCDCIQADGGTRTASITGGFVALVDLMAQLKRKGIVRVWPIKDFVAGVSVGVLNGRAYLDLDYEEDSSATCDLNVVMTGGGRFVEIQGTGEESTFSRSELDVLLALAEEGIKELIAAQKEALGERLVKNFPEL